MKYGDLYEIRCAIVLRAFRVIGRRPVPDVMKGPPQRLSVQDASVERVPGKDVGAKDVQRGVEGGLGKATGVDSAGVCGSRGRLCSKHGISFSICLSNFVPVENMSLAKVSRECVFVTKELKDMTLNNLRFLCYYYYATSVYRFHGKGNRVDLPDCIVASIREMYPDEDYN